MLLKKNELQSPMTELLLSKLVLNKTNLPASHLLPRHGEEKVKEKS